MIELSIDESPKMLREALCLAQAALGIADPCHTAQHIARLKKLIDECDRHRPIGPDGRHGDLHTDTCGCELGVVGHDVVDMEVRHWIVAATTAARQTGNCAPMGRAVRGCASSAPPRPRSVRLRLPVAMAPWWRPTRRSAQPGSLLSVRSPVRARTTCAKAAETCEQRPDPTQLDDLRSTYRSEPSGVLMYGPMEPVYACRECPTRHCPVSYDAVCGERPCARFESEDSEPWKMELGSDWVRRMIGR